jgi:hypothetical protein
MKERLVFGLKVFKDSLPFLFGKNKDSRGTA